jgi:hypothetical protein
MSSILQGGKSMTEDLYTRSLHNLKKEAKQSTRLADLKKAILTAFIIAS